MFDDLYNYVRKLYQTAIRNRGKVSHKISNNI